MKDAFACPLVRNATVTADTPALISDTKVFSCGQYAQAVGVAADFFKTLGITPGARVAVCAENSPEYIFALWGLWRVGAVACLLSPRVPQDTLSEEITHTGCTHIVTSLPQLLAADVFSIPKIDIKVLGAAVPSGHGRGEYHYAHDGAATVMLTSGSSGAPKAAMQSFGNHYYSAEGANAHMPFGGRDRWLLSLPLYHVGGLSILWRAALGGGTVVIGPSQDTILDTIKKHRVTHVSLVPTQLHRLLQAPGAVPVLQSLKAILLGGSPIPDALIRLSVEDNLPVYVTYGLTEMASQVATSQRLTKESPLTNASVLKYREVKIAPDAEICVRGKTLFLGYLRHGRLELPVDKEGWFATGDLGCLQEDGSLSVLGRKDNMFISGGENIQPEEIEAHLCAMAQVARAAVVAVPHASFGFRPVAFIETKNNTRLTVQEVQQHLRNYLPKFKIPDAVYQWPQHNGSHGLKADRRMLAQLARHPRDLVTFS